MAIPIERYVKITSGVGGGSATTVRELIGRIFSDNPLIPADAVLEFSTAADVSAYFGTSSNLATMATQYFSYLSKDIVSPRKLSFARYAVAGAGPRVFGARFNGTLASVQAVIAGTLSIQFDSDTPVTVGPINLAAATSLTNAATLITTALAGNANPNVASCAVTYNAVDARFEVACALLTKPKLKFLAAGAGVTNLAEVLQLYAANGAINSTGVSAPQTIAQALQNSIDISNNFGSFTVDVPQTLNQHILAAQANALLNIEYMYLVPVLAADRATWSAALIGFSGTAMVLSDFATSGIYYQLAPMMILAATDYTRRNSVQNYMFKTFDNMPPLVLNSTDSNLMDVARVNYIGRTQQAGRTLDFFQRGVMCGGVTSPLDMNVYANEMWLKDSLTTAFINLLVGVNRVPANDEGRAQILSVLQSGIDDALFNGVISVGKSLSDQQKLYVTQRTGDELAWRQVESSGYYVNAEIQSFLATSGVTEYKAVYTLLYAKDDAIRLVEGTHVLI